MRRTVARQAKLQRGVDWFLEGPQDAILPTGYQDEESSGRALLDLARSEGPKQLRRGQAIVPVACLFVSFRVAY